MIGFYMYGRFGENEKVERTALLASESFLVTSLFTGVLKIGMGRVRPAVGGVDADTFRGPLAEGAGHSFPSGHTSTAFAIATVIANEYENVPLLTPISYGIASLTALSRLNDEKHWASDIVFGAALGYFTAKTILNLHSNKKGRHFTIYPRVDRRGGGLVLSTRF
jgi:membrane-associated phospholipid phosphatase